MQGEPFFYTEALLFLTKAFGNLYQWNQESC